jgi:hypothetical protein
MESFNESAQLECEYLSRCGWMGVWEVRISYIPFYERDDYKLAVVPLNARTLDLWDVDRMLRPIVIHAISAARIPPKHRGLCLFHLLYLAIISASISGNAGCFCRTWEISTTKDHQLICSYSLAHPLPKASMHTQHACFFHCDIKALLFSSSSCLLVHAWGGFQSSWPNLHNGEPAEAIQCSADCGPSLG